MKCIPNKAKIHGLARSRADKFITMDHLIGKRRELDRHLVGAHKEDLNSKLLQAHRKLDPSFLSTSRLIQPNQAKWNNDSTACPLTVRIMER